MTERLSELVLGLQRMGENVKLRGDDLRYNQHQEICDHIDAIDKLLGMVDKVRQTLLDERQRAMPVAMSPAWLDKQQQEKPPLMPHQEDIARMPRVVAQGSKAAQG